MSACKNSDEFPFLSALNIKDVNPGVSDHTGLKAGSGKIHPSYSPGTGEVIASTSEGTLEDYKVVFLKISFCQFWVQNVGFGPKTVVLGNLEVVWIIFWPF